MSPAAMTALSVVELIGYLGFAGLGGLLMFRVLVTPERGRERRVMQIAVSGLGLMAASALLRLAVLLGTGSAAGPVVALAIVQLGVLVAVGCYLPDLLGSPLMAWRRAVAAAAAVALAVATALPTIVAAGTRAAFGGVLTAAHLLAIGTWVGGVIAVALMVFPAAGSAPRALPFLQELLRRTSGKAAFVIVVLVLTGLVALLVQGAPAGSVGGAYWTVLALKIVVVAGLIVAAVRLRQRIRREIFRHAHPGGEAGAGMAVLRRLVTVEMVLAAAAVTATAVLTVLAPLG